MDLDTTTNGLAHELWAMAQGAGSIEDAVTPMMAELLEFAQSVRAEDRERCANVVRYWVAGYAVPTHASSHEARCLAHIIDGRPAPVGPCGIAVVTPNGALEPTYSVGS